MTTQVHYLASGAVSCISLDGLVVMEIAEMSWYETWVTFYTYAKIQISTCEIGMGTAKKGPRGA